MLEIHLRAAEIASSLAMADDGFRTQFKTNLFEKLTTARRGLGPYVVVAIFL